MGILLWLAVAYVAGSIPFGLIFARMLCGTDPRAAGSGNVGATNVARLCGTKLGAMTLVCDALKGAIPVAVALSISDSTLFHSLTALAALLGHMHSCFLRFKGGKAVATTVGVFLPLAFWPLVFSGIACLTVIWRSGFVSLGSLTLVTAMPVMLLLGGYWKFLPLSLVVMVLVYWTHRENIARLARGEEKPWQKKRHEAACDETATAEGFNGPTPCDCGCSAHAATKDAERDAYVVDSTTATTEKTTVAGCQCASAAGDTGTQVVGDTGTQAAENAANGDTSASPAATQSSGCKCASMAAEKGKAGITVGKAPVLGAPAAKMPGSSAAEPAATCKCGKTAATNCMDSKA